MGTHKSITLQFEIPKEDEANFLNDVRKVEQKYNPQEATPAPLEIEELTWEQKRDILTAEYAYGNSVADLINQIIEATYPQAKQGGEEEMWNTAFLRRLEEMKKDREIDPNSHDTTIEYELQWLLNLAKEQQYNYNTPAWEI